MGAMAPPMDGGSGTCLYPAQQHALAHLKAISKARFSRLSFFLVRPSRQAFLMAGSVADASSNPPTGPPGPPPAAPAVAPAAKVPGPPPAGPPTVAVHPANAALMPMPPGGDALAANLLYLSMIGAAANPKGKAAAKKPPSSGGGRRHVVERLCRSVVCGAAESAEYMFFVMLALTPRIYSSSYPCLAKFPDHLLQEMLTHCEPVYCNQAYLKNCPRHLS